MATKNDTKNTASSKSDPSVENPNTQGLPDFDKWSDEQIGFAPYWTPAEGKWFFGAPIAIDMRDPNFIRYQFLAGADTPCQRGPADEDNERNEKVMVKKGETFSLSVYYALRDTFDQYLQYGADSGKPVLVRVDTLTKVPTTKGNSCWQFRARISPEQKKELSAWRAKNVKVLSAGTDRPELEK